MRPISDHTKTQRALFSVDQDCFRCHGFTDCVLHLRGGENDTGRVAILWRDFYDVDFVDGEDDALGWDTIGPQFYGNADGELFINGIRDRSWKRCGLYDELYVLVDTSIVLWDQSDSYPSNSLTMLVHPTQVVRDVVSAVVASNRLFDRIKKGRTKQRMAAMRVLRPLPPQLCQLICVLAHLY